MAERSYVSDWHDVVVYSKPGPTPHLLVDEPGLRVLIAGLEPGGRIPPHAAPRAIYHALEGDGVINLDGVLLPFAEGAVVVAPEGASRGIEAVSRLAFLAVRIGSEAAPAK